jgi:hypothetical protein
MFAAYHVDRKGQSVLMKLFKTEAEAVDWVNDSYADRFREQRDRDTVQVVQAIGELNRIVQTWSVDYMPVFDAVKTWSFKSSSGSGSYVTQINGTGILSCNCRGWTFKKPGKARWCKHTTEVIHREGLKVIENGDYLFIDDQKLKAAKKKYSATSTFMNLVEAYESVINRMARMDPKNWVKIADEVEVAKFKVETYMELLENKDVEGIKKYEAANRKFGQILS